MPRRVLISIRVIGVPPGCCSFVPVNLSSREEGKSASTEVGSAPDQVPATLPRPVSSRQFFAHALGLLVLLLALLPLIDNGQLAIPDEGVYTAQADNLARGAWAQDRPTADIDRHGDWFIVTGSTIVGDQAIPYARRPLYPTMLSPFFGWSGVGGALVLSILGTWVAACAAAGIAAELTPRAVLPSLWLVGLGTPLLFDAYLAVGHSWTAAFAAVCAFALVRALRPSVLARVTVAWMALALGSAALCTLVRSEGVIAVLALASSMFVMAVLRRSEPIRARARTAALAVLLAATGVAAYAINDLWAKGITAAAGVDPTFSDRMPDFLGAAWSGLLRPWYPNNTSANAAMALVLVGSLAAPLVIRATPRLRLLGLGLLTIVAAAALYRAISAPTLVSGFVPATPWIAVGVLSLRRRDLARAPAPALALACAVATLAVLATSYGYGGRAEWGGRFFHMIIPWLAPLAVVGLFAIKQSTSRFEWVVIAVAVVAMTASLSVMSLRANAEWRRFVGDVAAFIGQVRDDAPSDPVVLSTLSGDGTPRTLWQLSSTSQPLLTSGSLIDLKLLLDTMPAKVTGLQVLTEIPSREQFGGMISRTRRSRWNIVSSTQSDNTGFFAYALERK